MRKISNEFLLFFFPKINSPKWRVGLRDSIQALLRATLTGCFTVIIQSLNEGKMVFDWEAVAIAGLTAGFGYVGYAWLNGKEKQ